MPSPHPLGIHLFCACNGLSLQTSVTFYLRAFCSHGDARPAHRALWRCWGGDASRNGSQPKTNGSFWIKTTSFFVSQVWQLSGGSVLSPRALQWDWAPVALTSNLLINTSCIWLPSLPYCPTEICWDHLPHKRLSTQVLVSASASLETQTKILGMQTKPIFNKSMEKWNKDITYNAHFMKLNVTQKFFSWYYFFPFLFVLLPLLKRIF